jgi:branched-chain amino acid transport system substrate-binding protein
MRVWRHLGWGGLLALVTSVGAVPLVGQTEAPMAPPYASMDPAKVAYRGPGRLKSNDIQREVVNIGVLLAMQGQRAFEGKQLLPAAQIAIEEENRSRPLPNGQRFALAVEDESGPWGQASNAMVRLIMQDESVALVTSTDGNIAHQAEQIANKVGIPVVTLSSDPTTTRINIPWIFRVAPSDAKQARAIAAEIYDARGSHKVLLITETGHDGRIGGEEFAKATVSRYGQTPIRSEVNPDNFSIDAIVQEVKTAQADAVVFWTGSKLADQLLATVRKASPPSPIYVCQKAADFLPQDILGAMGQDALVFTVGVETRDAEFASKYREKTGSEPGIAAQQLNQAVQAIAEAVRQAGTNRARVRDRLAANTPRETNAGGVISFDAAGNAQSQAHLVSVAPGPGNELK